MLEIARYEDGHRKTTYFNPFLGYYDPIKWLKEHLDILASFYEHAPVDRGWILFEYAPSNMKEYHVIRKFLDLVEEIERNLNRSA
jgi:hypothetical protein